MRQLLVHRSGMVDSNDISNHPRRYLARIRDPAVRAMITRISRRSAANPDYEFSSRRWVEVAAALPLEHPPGTTFHYSNIGYDVAGLIAEKAGGADLATLVRRRITGPLGLDSAAYDPHSRITGAHAHGYGFDAHGRLVDKTGVTEGVGAGGGIVANAEDEAAFVRGLVQGRLLRPAELRALETPLTGSIGPGERYGLGTSVYETRCGGRSYGHGGAMAGFRSQVLASGDGKRIAVLLLNGREPDDSESNASFTAVTELFCAA